MLASRHGARLKPEKGAVAETAVVRSAGKVLVLAVPHTYMNDSGMAVRVLARRYVGEDASRIVILHDELDLEPGVVRLKEGGGIAGHNGLRSIGQHLHTRDFIRVRIGVGKPAGRAAGVDHVLSRPGRKEREVLDIARETAADAVEVLVSDGVVAAMNRFNCRT